MSWHLFQNSLLVASLATALAAALGLTGALFLAGVERRGRHSLLAMAVAALAMPPFLATNCWLDLLGNAGVLHRWLPLNIYSPGGTIWILALLTWPITLLAALASWQRLQPSQLESEPGMAGATLIRWVLWPMARKAVGLAAILTFVLTLNNFAVPAILQVKVASAEVWVSFNTQLDPLAALRLGWPLIVVPLAVVALLGRLGDSRWPRLEGMVAPRLFRRQLGRGWFVLCAALTILLVAVSFVAPLASLAAAPRTWQELLPTLAAGTPALVNSIWSAALAASASVAAGWLMAGCRARANEPRGSAAETTSPHGRARGPQDGGITDPEPFALQNVAMASMRKMSQTFRSGAVLLLPLVAPGVFLGISLIWALNRPGLDWLYRSSAVIVLALGIRYLGPAWFGADASHRGVDRDLVDSARLDGAAGWTLFRHVHWPQMAPQMAAVWYVIYLLCLWDVETIILILPPGGETLALRIFNLLHYGHNAQVNALCVWLLAAALLPLGAWQLARGFCSLRSAAAAGRRRPAILSSLLVLTALAGCTPKAGPGKEPVTSRFFSHVEIIGSRGAGPGEFNKPRSLVVDRQDNLYVVDMTGRVQKFSREGKLILAWQMPQTDLGKPKGMACDLEGNIVVLEPHYQRVNHFSPDGGLVARWGGQGTNAGRFSLPRAVAVNSRNEIVVSEYTLCERVQVFSARGTKLLGHFGQPGTSPGQFNRAEGLAVDGANRIYVADSCNHRVQVFSPDGGFLRAYGKAGSGPGEFSYPYDVRVDEAGRQYVCEFGNSRIQILDASDKPLEILGGAGAKPGCFANPWSLALDSAGNLYVADSQNHRVQKFVRRGTTVQ